MLLRTSLSVGEIQPKDTSLNGKETHFLFLFFFLLSANYLRSSLGVDMPKDMTVKTDLFKALSHPTRRKILRLLAMKGAVSYTDLTKLEPKAGVLYHHLKLLGDLIYQDENKLYRLNERGQKAYEFLENFFLEPTEKSFHKFIVPRRFLERLEGWGPSITLILLCILSSLVWQLQDEYIQIFIFIAPQINTNLPPTLISIASWVASSIILAVIVRMFYQHYCNIIDMLVKTVPGFWLINIFPLVLYLIPNLLLEIIVYLILQIFALFFIVSAVSIVGRVNLRKSALVVISHHYISIALYLIMKNLLI